MPPLEIARLAVLVAHFVALAALIGPYLLHWRNRNVPRLRLMLIGAIGQVVTGNALIATRQLQGLDVGEFKMVVKLSIAVAALGLLLAAALVKRRRGETAPPLRPLFHTAGSLALVNVIVAVAWT